MCFLIGAEEGFFGLFFFFKLSVTTMWLGWLQSCITSNKCCGQSLAIRLWSVFEIWAAVVWVTHTSGGMSSALGFLVQMFILMAFRTSFLCICLNLSHSWTPLALLWLLSASVSCCYDFFFPKLLRDASGHKHFLLVLQQYCTIKTWQKSPRPIPVNSLLNCCFLELRLIVYPSPLLEHQIGEANWGCKQTPRNLVALQWAKEIFGFWQSSDCVWFFAASVLFMSGFSTTNYSLFLLSLICMVCSSISGPFH